MTQKKRTGRAVFASLVITVAALVSGCEGESPTAPRPFQPPAAAGSPTFKIAGVVQDLPLPLQPVANARVEIVDSPLAGRVVTTNVEGRFAFAEPVEAPVTLRVTKDGYAPETVRSLGENIRIELMPLGMVDLTGEYTFTLAAADSCEGLPEAVRSPTYLATIKRDTRLRHQFIATLSGEFYPGYSEFAIGLHRDAIRFSVYSLYAFNAWLEDHPIVARSAPQEYLAFMGQAAAPQPGADGSIAATLDGWFEHCSAAREPGPNFPPSCSVPPTQCRSQEHRLMLSRR